MSANLFQRFCSFLGGLFLLLIAVVAILKSASAFAAESATVSAKAGDELIQLRSVAEVDGAEPEITLGDLIIARGVSKSALEKLRAVRLADTPHPGESRSFTSVGLEQIFLPHLREIEKATGEKIALRIPARVTVLRKTMRIRQDDVEKELRTQLKALCADCLFDIQQLTLPAVPPTLAAGATWQVRLRTELPKGNFSIPLEVKNEDSSKSTYWITGTIAIRKRVAVASRTIEFGEHMRPEDYNMQEKDVTFATDNAALESEIASSVAGKQVAAGQVIWRGGLRREMAVKFGDPVRIFTGDDDWQITMEGVAQSQGYIGDMIRVKIPRTQKIVSGLLKEKGMVEVH